MFTVPKIRFDDDDDLTFEEVYAPIPEHEPTKQQYAVVTAIATADATHANNHTCVNTTAGLYNIERINMQNSRAYELARNIPSGWCLRPPILLVPQEYIIWNSGMLKVFPYEKEWPTTPEFFIGLELTNHYCNVFKSVIKKVE